MTVIERLAAAASTTAVLPVTSPNREGLVFLHARGIDHDQIACPACVEDHRKYWESIALESGEYQGPLRADGTFWDMAEGHGPEREFGFLP